MYVTSRDTREWGRTPAKASRDLLQLTPHEYVRPAGIREATRPPRLYLSDHRYTSSQRRGSVSEIGHHLQGRQPQQPEGRAGEPAVSAVMVGLPFGWGCPVGSVNVCSVCWDVTQDLVAGRRQPHARLVTCGGVIVRKMRARACGYWGVRCESRHLMCPEPEPRPVQAGDVR